MYLNFGIVIDAVLFALGAWWCYEVYGRWRSDLDELRSVQDKTRKAIIIGLWLLTLLIAALVMNFAFGVIRAIVVGVHGLFT